jgi:hypothetical protein
MCEYENLAYRQAGVKIPLSCGMDFFASLLLNNLSINKFSYFRTHF